MKKLFTGFAAALAAVSIIGNTVAVLAEDAGETMTDTSAPTQLITYKAPSTSPLVENMNGSYKVKARPQGAGDDAWQELDVYTVQVMSNGTRNAAMTYFDCTGAVDVQVTVTGGVDYFDDIDETTSQKKGLLAKGTTTEFKPANGAMVNTPIDTKIYPESYNIEPQYEEGGDTINFTVEPGQRIVLDPNGDTRRNLQIWADYPIDMPTVEELQAEGKTVAVVDASNGDNLAASYDEDVVYIKPGFYSEGYKETTHYMKDNQTWYLEGGAVIQGSINMDFTTNAKLIGRGLMWRPQYASITVNDAVNAHIEGMMGLNHGWADNGGYFINVANSRNVYVKNLKSIGRHKWGDTMDIFCSEDVTVEGCFFRGNDDCIAIYASKIGEITADSGNIKDVTDSNGVIEVTKEKHSAALQFDLSTKDKESKVIKSAMLRLTPMVSKTNLQQTVSLFLQLMIRITLC